MRPPVAAVRLLLLGVALAALGSASFAKDRGTLIDLSVAEDGSCLARIGDQTVAATVEELTAKLPLLIPNRKTPVRLGESYEKVPYRCFTPLLASLTRLGYESVVLELEQPPLDPEITTPDLSAQ